MSGHRVDPVFDDHERIVRVDGSDVAVVDVGARDGDVLVLVHGIGASWRFWRSILAPLATEHRVLALDLPGFGRSAPAAPRLTPERTAVTLRHVFDYLEIERVSLCGHSMGGIAVLEYAARYPDQTDRLALVSAALIRVTGFFKEPLESVMRYPITAAMLGIQLLNATIPIPKPVRSLVVEQHWLRSMTLWPYVANPDALDDDALEQALRGPGTLGTLNATLGGIGYDLLAAASRVRVPVLVLNGTADRLVSIEEVKVLSAALAEPAEVLLEGVGHWPPLEAPDAVTSALLHFFAPEREG